MYIDERKEKKETGEQKLTKKSGSRRQMTYLPSYGHVSPALAQAIGRFEVDGMTISL
jgi:hypothetical protein